METSIAEGNLEIESKEMKVTVKNLTFGYSEDKSILQDICLQLSPGERLGIMGESGCGKTTLVKVLARLYEFKKGEILLNGINIKKLKGKNLRGVIAYCTQEVQFLHETLRENIGLLYLKYKLV